MSKPDVAVVRKTSLRGHEEETTRTRLSMCLRGIIHSFVFHISLLNSVSQWNIAKKLGQSTAFTASEKHPKLAGYQLKHHH